MRTEKASLRLLHRSYIILLSVILIQACDNNSDNKLADRFGTLKGDFLGREIPVNHPEVFAPGLVSHGYHELGITVSPDGDQIFYVTAFPKYSYYVIVGVERKSGIWQPPQIAPFSGAYSDYSPRFSPDGQRLYFSSTRPNPGSDLEKVDYDIWMIERQNGAWSEPEWLGEPINTHASEINASVSSSNNIYFQAKHDDNFGFDIYVSELVDGQYSKPVRLPEEINSNYNDGGPCISPDETLLLFHSSRPGGSGRSDLFSCRRNSDGDWGTPTNLGPTINSADSETLPFLTFDGSCLFYTSFAGPDTVDFKNLSYERLIGLLNDPRSGNGTLMWIKYSDSK